MTLTQGRFISYEYDRMVVLFSMHDEEKEIHCAISTSAMDELEGGALGRAGHQVFQNLAGRVCAALPRIERGQPQIGGVELGVHRDGPLELDLCLAGFSQGGVSDAQVVVRLGIFVVGSDGFPVLRHRVRVTLRL